jgi:hypothetical protein
MHTATIAANRIGRPISSGTAIRFARLQRTAWLRFYRERPAWLAKAQRAIHSGEVRGDRTPQPPGVTLALRFHVLHMFRMTTFFL